MTAAAARPKDKNAASGPLSPAERQRRKRARVRAGLSILTLTVPIEALGDFLVESGEIEEWDRDDRAALQRGLEVLINRSVLPDDTA